MYTMQIILILSYTAGEEKRETREGKAKKGNEDGRSGIPKGRIPKRWIERQFR
jgi:hypothetical protein